MGVIESGIFFISTAAFVFAGLFIIHFSRGLRPKKRMSVWFIAAFGFLIYSVYNYFQLSSEADIINALTVLDEPRALRIVKEFSIQRDIAKGLAGSIGALSILYGLSAIFYEITTGEVSFSSPSFLTRRMNEIKETIDNVTERYETNQITQEDFSRIKSDLIKELAELEVRLRK